MLNGELCPKTSWGDAALVWLWNKRLLQIANVGPCRYSPHYIRISGPESLQDPWIGEIMVTEKMERRDMEERSSTVVRPQMRMNGVSGEKRDKKKEQTISAEALIDIWQGLG